MTTVWVTCEGIPSRVFKVSLSLPPQVPAEPVCQNVFGPSVFGDQQDLWAAGRGPNLTMHVR